MTEPVVITHDHQRCDHPASTNWKYTYEDRVQRVSCELCGCEDVVECGPAGPDADLWTPLTPATLNGDNARTCKRHQWLKHADGTVQCERCLRPRDEERAKRGKSSRRLGSDQERRAERVYGLEKIGERGDIVDLQDDWIVVQQKASRRPVPAWLLPLRKLMARTDGRTPALLLTFVGPHGTYDFWVIPGAQPSGPNWWRDLHGNHEEDVA